MNIKARLSVRFTLLVTGILVFFTILIYYFTFTNQREKFRNNLLVKAQNTAILLIDVVEVDSTLLKKIHQSTISLKEEEIVITDSNLRIIWSNNIEYLTDNLLNTTVIPTHYSFFGIEEKDGIVYKHIYHKRTYFVYVMAYDINRKEYLSDLISVSLWSILFSLWLSVLLSYLFSKYAIQPLTKVINQIETINSTKLSERIELLNTKDEIGQLGMTFNKMLDNIEDAFNRQEEFVSNASHELKTPLAVLIAEAGYMLSRDRPKEEYVNYIEGTVNELKEINTLLFSLLELAQIKQANIIPLSSIRIDEVIFASVYKIKKKYPDRKILTKIQYSESESDMLVLGNHGLLEIVFKNLIDNACKFSTEDVAVELKPESQYIQIQIIDKGIGIPALEIDSIFRPFNRASNVNLKSGFGIGLYIVQTVLKLHSVDVKITSKEKDGTSFILTFNKIRVTKKRST
jgi:signal transduction histidine kinase